MSRIKLDISEIKTFIYRDFILSNLNNKYFELSLSQNYIRIQITLGDLYLKFMLKFKGDKILWFYTIYFYDIENIPEPEMRI